MRERLVDESSTRDRNQNKNRNRRLYETVELVKARTKFEHAEEELREMKATVIAERVARDQIERQNDMTTEDMKDCRNELASAIRALRRSREEGRRTDEERRKYVRCFEMTKTQ